MNDLPVIGYLGMTHLGLCSAVAAASKGFTTLAFDTDAALVSRLEDGVLPVVEPGLDALCTAHRSRLSFSADRSAIARCDVVYVAPDVPTDDSGGSDYTTLDRLLSIAMQSAKPQATVVVLSQVAPGYTRMHQGDRRPLYYQVETLVFGRAVERATLPERFMVGTPNPSQPLPPPLRSYLEAFGCPILPMRLESAELAKISINCCLVASITVANTLAEVCENVAADWSEIAPALKLDKRIGEFSYLSPGLGIAGGNLERDLATVLRLSESYGTEATLIRAFRDNSAHRQGWALRTLHTALLADKVDARVAVLGLTYKENTHSVKNSPSLALIRQLAPWPVQVYDPVAPASVAVHPAVTGAASALEAARGADALVIMAPWAEFRSIAPAALAEAMRGRLVLDPFRALDGRAAREAGLDYRTLGVN
jgi:UDPglucose 6-dehydrogenase